MGLHQRLQGAPQCGSQRENIKVWKNTPKSQQNDLNITYFIRAAGASKLYPVYIMSNYSAIKNIWPSFIGSLEIILYDQYFAVVWRDSAIYNWAKNRIMYTESCNNSHALPIRIEWKWPNNSFSKFKLAWGGENCVLD